MHYPIAIERGNDNQAFGVIVPDIPGCHSAGESIDDAICQAKEAIVGHLQILAEEGEPLPMPRAIQDHINKAEFVGFVWALAEVNEAEFLGKAEKINITLPAYLVARIDRFVSTHPEFKTRSGLLAVGALKLIA